MRRSTIAGLLAVATLLGCQSEEKVWYRARYIYNDGWLIARADPEAETCTLMFIAEAHPDENESWVTGIHVFETLRGKQPRKDPPDNPWTHAHVKWVRDAPVDVHLCTTSLDSLGESLGTEGSGAISMSRTATHVDDYDFNYVYSYLTLCSLRIDAEVGGVHFRENLHIFGQTGCDAPKKEGPRHDVAAIGAHFSVGAEGPELVVSGEDREFDSCVWQHYRVVKDPDDDVDLPPRWEFTGAGVGLRANDESCDPATVRDDFLDRPYVSTLGLDTKDRTPSLEFQSSEVLELDDFDVDVPCRIALDVTHKSGQQYHWVPARLHFEGKGIEVSGACGD